MLLQDQSYFVDPTNQRTWLFNVSSVPNPDAARLHVTAVAPRDNADTWYDLNPTRKQIDLQTNSTQPDYFPGGVLIRVISNFQQNDLISVQLIARIANGANAHRFLGTWILGIPDRSI